MAAEPCGQPHAVAVLLAGYLATGAALTVAAWAIDRARYDRPAPIDWPRTLAGVALWPVAAWRTLTR